MGFDCTVSASRVQIELFFEDVHVASHVRTYAPKPAGDLASTSDLIPFLYSRNQPSRTHTEASDASFPPIQCWTLYKLRCDRLYNQAEYILYKNTFDPGKAERRATGEKVGVGVGVCHQSRTIQSTARWPWIVTVFASSCFALACHAIACPLHSFSSGDLRLAARQLLGAYP